MAEHSFTASKDSTFAPPPLDDTLTAKPTDEIDLVEGEIVGRPVTRIREMKTIRRNADGTLPGDANNGRVIVLQEGISHGESIAELSKSIPNNEFGLPIFFYRSDLIPHSETQIEQSTLDNAAVKLSYIEGYPTLPEGQAFWGQLLWEPANLHLLFQRFVDMGYIHGIRQLDLLAREEKVDLQLLRAAHGEYYWTARARAHDLFVAAAEQKKREHRIRTAENSAFLQSTKMYEQIIKKFDDPAWIEGLEPMEALEALETIIKLQRQALGLSSNARSAAGTDPNRAASTEFIMRTLTKNVGLSDRSAGAMQEQLDILLSDPEAGMQAQELILRLNSHIG